ncbi:hypothetical protein [Pandoraea terrigena]|uniref:Uncharacterized protein n=1 Tax=Pandoraea terrigena TaxID=2508292 RepID=A0A5E4YVY1_9BURK|nr:hypothetical protein [Pandoraea terrigena]VVE52598.1 hypothetical protein PTE31013_04826 [Pandoraea terrigena]
MFEISCGILLVTGLVIAGYSWKRTEGMMLLMMVFLSLAMCWSFSVLTSDGAKTWMSPELLLWVAGLACFARARIIDETKQA